MTGPCPDGRVRLIGGPTGDLDRDVYECERSNRSRNDEVNEWG